MTDQRQINIISAWTTAAEELGLVVRPLFSISTDSGQTIRCTLLIENFGSKLGTVIFTDIDQRPDPIFSSKGYYVSTLGDGYSQYDRDFFVDTLNDWGFYGDPLLKPDWYTGHYWGNPN